MQQVAAVGNPVLHARNGLELGTKAAPRGKRLEAF